MRLRTLKKHHLNSKQHGGFSLLEVLITVVITAFGLIGLAGLQTSSVNSTTISAANTHTMIAIKEIVGQLIANRDAAVAGEFNIPALDSSGTLQAFSVDLQPSDPTLAENIAYNWFSHLNDVVPGAKAGLHCNGMGMCAIRVQLSDALDNEEQTVSIQL